MIAIHPMSILCQANRESESIMFWRLIVLCLMDKCCFFQSLILNHTVSQHYRCWSSYQPGSNKPPAPIRLLINMPGRPTPSAQPSVSAMPSSQPSSQPSIQPSSQPSSLPSEHPSSQPSSQPSLRPSSQPSSQPSLQPSSHPSESPSVSHWPTSQHLRNGDMRFQLWETSAWKQQEEEKVEKRKKRKSTRAKGDTRLLPLRASILSHHHGAHP